MKDDRLYLLHIEECITRVQNYTAGGKEVFWTDIKTQDAVIRNLQTLAESTLRLSTAAKAKRAEVDWRSIAGFRNIVVHDYLGLDLDEIWDIVSRDIPLLKSAIEALLKDLGLNSSQALRK